MRPLRDWLTRGLTVLVYHEVTSTPSAFQRISDGSVTPETFERQIGWLQKRFSFIAPTDLPQLGGNAALPANAALITFDDAWAGVYRCALPILAAHDLPALCFVNMGTVEGSPDLAAVRRYEQLRSGESSPSIKDSIDVPAAEVLLARITEQYADDREFLEFQGETASLDELQATADSGQAVWFGSHLHHHWKLRSVGADVVRKSIRSNWHALARYPNTVAALATPYGDSLGLPLDPELGLRVVFVATGSQNRRYNTEVLDRLELEPGSSTPSEWWWSLHRRRLFGNYAS